MEDRVKLPRRQRADKLELLLFWRDEAPAWLRHNCRNDYVIFVRYIEMEAERLIESVKT